MEKCYLTGGQTFCPRLENVNGCLKVTTRNVTSCIATVMWTQCLYTYCNARLAHDFQRSLALVESVINLDWDRTTREHKGSLNWPNFKVKSRQLNNALCQLIRSYIHGVGHSNLHEKGFNLGIPGMSHPSYLRLKSKKMFVQIILEHALRKKQINTKAITDLKKCQCRRCAELQMTTKKWVCKLFCINYQTLFWN